MWIVKKDKDLGYGICLNSCNCEVIKARKKTYKLNKGTLVKLFEFNGNTSVGLMVLNDKCKLLYLTKSLSFDFIEPKLFKYLNAITTFEERLKFYKNKGRREFVLHLEKNRIVGVGFSNENQTTAEFLELNEQKDKIFITVELLEKPSNEIIHRFKNVSNKHSTKNCIYSFPANMIRTLPFPDIDQKNDENFENGKTLCESYSSTFQNKNQNSVVHFVIRPTRNYPDKDIPNYSTPNVRINKSISVAVEPPKTTITSQNPTGSGQLENYHEPHENKTLDTSYNKASNDEPKNDFTGEIEGQYTKYDEKIYETPVEPPLIVPSNSKVCVVCLNGCERNICLTCDNNMEKNDEQNNSQANVELNISLITSLVNHKPINSRLCDICSNVSESNICLSCNKEKVYEQNNFQTDVELNIQLVTSLVSETSSLQIPTHHEINDCVTNEDDLHNNSTIAVRHNISASNCIICRNYLATSEGFVLLLCKHTFCEMCIKNQITLIMVDHTNILPCCDRPIELHEIKYFLYNHEYEQFKAASDIQQCFDKNCTGYHLWKECDEERPITFTCNKCKLDNCLKCGTIHVNLTCGQYDKITNSVDNETGEVFLTWIREGIAMPCPKCEALIEKDEGCDWVQCLFCNTEICWATRGSRWGPDGKGDTSGGCKCDYDVKKCVDSCNYCH